jgi:hypothetical protein
VDLEFLMSLFMRAQGIWKSRCHYLWEPSGFGIPNVIIYESPVDLEFLMSLFIRDQWAWNS